MENSYATPEQSENILDGADYSLQRAGAGRRLANYLIDLIVWIVALFIYVTRSAAASPAAFDRYDNGDSVGVRMTVNFWGALIYVCIMTLMEALSKGKSLGKLITSTRAVNEDGSNISFKTALLRSLSRIVPFEAFSALGNPSNPWHDRWTKTYVIDERKSHRPD